MEKSIDISIVEGRRAAKVHVCSLCHDGIQKGAAYTFMTSRLKTERYPVTFRVCNRHQAALIPLGLLLNRE